MHEQIWLNEKRILATTPSTQEAGRREHLIARRFSLRSPILRPYVKSAKRIANDLWPAIMADDKRQFCKLRLGVAVALACDWPWFSPTELGEIEEFAYLRARQGDWLQYMAKHAVQHATQPQKYLETEFLELVAKLKEESQQLVKSVVVDREKQDDIAAQSGQSQSATSKQLNRLIDQLHEAEVQRQRREFPLFFE